MKVTLKEPQEIKGREFDIGDEIIVNKVLGERMIEEGVANRVIEVKESLVVEQPQNRMTPVRFSKHRKIFDGSDGKRYVKNGDTYVEFKG